MSRFFPALSILCVSLAFATLSPEAKCQQSTDILPLDQVHTGMQGYAYTIFSGDQVEKFDLQVLGVMPNFLGPKQSIILVQLKGPKVEHTGVVAGMSGSPVYLDGKLAGALSLKLGIFTKEAIGGVTPIEDVLRPPAAGAKTRSAAPVFELPKETVAQNTLPSGSALEPIETPLVFSGFLPATLQPFAGELQSYGLVAAQGGTAPDQKDDAHAHLEPGGMAGMVLVRGDMSIQAACTVTAVTHDQVFLCGHPFLNLGDIQIPMARSEVVTTLSSSLASTKIVNSGGLIGTITSDHLTAVTGRLGASPRMVPMDLTFVTGSTEKTLHFELANHPKLTPLLVAMTTFNGITQNSLYGEGTTLHLTGDIELKGHSPVKLENTFAPQDSLLPDGMPVALEVESIFGRLFTNNFEIPDVQHVSLKVESLPGRNSYSIDSAWLETGDVLPGEDLKVRVQLRPYRGETRVEETIVHVPDQIPRGTTLRILVSDADWMNRASHGFGFGNATGAASGPAGLDQLISLINLERHNDRLYVGLFVPAPMMVWDDKEMPNVPLSAISIIDGRPAPGSVQVLRESLASESSIVLGGPVSGLISLNLQVR